MTDYASFLLRKLQANDANGFSPNWLPDWLFPFQRELVDWSARMGRGALFATVHGNDAMLQAAVEATRAHVPDGVPVQVRTAVRILGVNHPAQRIREERDAVPPIINR